ncbi:MAG: rhodanese-like domain-containing protein [Mycoplasmataceae bacterium]|jgi:hypothetical protein|nr:rhodanese-like domain-containing protein [Mycoplasmataceae bacterium]
MRSRKFDNPFKTRLDIKFLSKKKFNKYVYKDGYQIVDIRWDYQYNKNHILFSSHFTPTNFKYQYEQKLNKNSKIIIIGNWRNMVRFYRILDFANYKVYLLK